MTGTDPLEEMLSRDPHLDDDGFTARVLAALPRRRRGARRAVLAAAAGAASLLAAAFLPGAVASALEALAAWPAQVGLAPAALLSGLAAALAPAALVWGAVEAAREG